MKIMIVEDERTIREGLSEMIDWQQEGFEYPLLFSGAVEALEFLEGESVDVVITDLYMPVLNGIEFIRMLREQNQLCEVIILTGHERFELAQKAILLGVKRYLLKPVTKTQIQETLREIKNEAEEKMKLKDWITIAKKRISEYLPVIQNQFFNDLLAGNINDSKTIQEHAVDAEIQIPDTEISCLAIRRKEEKKEYNRVTEEVALEQLTKEVLHTKYLYSLTYDSIQILICKGRISRADVEILSESVRQNLNIQVHFGISDRGYGVLSVKELAVQAVEAVQSIREDNGIFYVYFKDIEWKRRSRMEYPYDMEQEMTACLRLQKKPDRTLLKKFLEKILPPRYSAEESRILLLWFLSALGRNANEAGVEITAEFFLAERAIQRCQNVEEYLYDIMLKITEEKERISRRYTEVLVQSAVRYIEENFADPELSVGKISEVIGVTPNYLSRIFKIERKSTCIDFLTELRIEAAKEKLCNSKDKTYVIAEEVGYLNPNYFSAVFKKHTGCTPKEYRERVKCDAEIEIYKK